MMPKRYRKKPVEVEAQHFDASLGWDEIVKLAEWCGGEASRDEMPMNQHKTYYWSIVIPTLEGRMRALPGDFIVKGTRGEFYPVKAGPFADTFEPVT